MNTKLFTSLDAGHRYEVKNQLSYNTQFIQFTKKTFDEDGLQDSQTDGTTTEAVISMLIDRLQVLDEINSSGFNIEAISYLNLAYEALYARTRERQERGVEGTNQT